VIHAQALIDPGARIGKNVTVGPYTVIGADVEIGEGTWVGPHVVINGPTQIGRDNKIFQFASIGEVPQDLKYAGEPTRLEIGDRNVFRECVTLSRGTVGGGGITKIGSDNLFMAYVHIAHDCQVGNHTIFANNASLAGHVEVGDFAILGGFAGIHQFCKIGAHVMIGAAAIALKDVPPYLMAYGNPVKPYGLNLRGLKRRGFSPAVIEALKDAYRIVFRSGLTIEAAIQQLQPLSMNHPEVAGFVDFLRKAERGISR